MDKREEEVMTMEAQSTIKDAALVYVAKGLAVIPLRGRYGLNYDNAKMPILKAWQKAVPDAGLVEKWFLQKPDIDIGLLCGKANNIFVLDADKAIGMATADALKLPNTVVNVTPKGKQYLFQWDVRLDGLPTNLVKPFDSLPGLDFRGEGGFIVAPPSKNLGDVQYAWLNGEGIDTKALAPIPEWLVQMFMERATVGEEVANAPEIETENWFEKIKDGVSEGENRHRAMTKLASFYMSRGLPEDDVILLMTTWNQKCTPPKDENEFLIKLNEFLDNWRTGKYKSNYKAPVTELKAQSFKEFMTAGETKIDWLVQDLIPQESLTFLYGYQGIGKSFLALDLAIEIGRGGGKWINRFPVEGGRVLYIDEESHPTLLRTRYTKLLAAKGLTIEDLSDISFISRQQLKFDNDNSISALKALITELRPDIVMVDSFSAIHSLNENAAQDMARLRDYFQSIIADCKTGLLFIDHEGQPSMVLKTAAQKQRGSALKGDMADCKILLSEMDGKLVVEHAKPRWGEKQPSFGVEIVNLAPDKIAVNFNGLV